MRLISISHRAEGERVDGGRLGALLNIWWTYAGYQGVKLLRGVGVSITLPLPTFFKYRDTYMGGNLMSGMRFPTLAFAMWFVRGDKRNRQYRAVAWMRPVRQQKLIATQQDIEDGLYPVSSTTKGEANVRAN